MRVSPFAGALLLLSTVAATPALAQDDAARFCPDRPGLGSSTCSTEPGRLDVEVGIGNWTIDRNEGSRSDSVAIGDSFLRYGIDGSMEVQIGFTAYTHNYDRSGGAIAKDGGFSDVRLGVRRNLIGNDGGAVALAIEPYVTLPVGASAVSDGDWGAGVILPSSFVLGSGFSLGATSVVAAAADQDGDGRHLSLSQYLGIGRDLAATVSATAELGLSYDDDPLGNSWAPVASVSFGWTPRALLQFDAGTVVALDGDSPNLQLYVGVSRLF